MTNEDDLSYTSYLIRLYTYPLPRSGPTTDDLKSRDEFAGGTYSYQSEIDGRIVPAAAACPTICCQLYHSDYSAPASAGNFTAFMLLTTNNSSIYVPTASSTLLFLSSVIGSLQGSLVCRKARPNQIGGMYISTLVEPNQMKLGFMITNDKADIDSQEKE